MQKKIIFFRFFFCKSKIYRTFAADFGLCVFCTTFSLIENCITYIKNINYDKSRTR